MTKDELDAIREQCNRATAGPWNTSRTDMDSYTENPDDPEKGCQYVCYVYPPDRQRIPVFGANAREDAEFIADAREYIPRLLDALDEAEGCEGCNAQNARWKLAVRNATERRKQAEAERDVLAERLARVAWARENDGLPYVIEVNSASAWLAWAQQKATKGT